MQSILNGIEVMTLISSPKTYIKAMNDIASRRYVEITAIVSISRLDLKRETLPIAWIYMILAKHGNRKKYEE
jgi:hypothetical protein